MKDVGIYLRQLILSYLIVSFSIPASFPFPTASEQVCVYSDTFMEYSFFILK